MASILALKSSRQKLQNYLFWLELWKISSIVSLMEFCPLNVLLEPYGDHTLMKLLQVEK